MSTVTMQMRAEQTLAGALETATAAVRKAPGQTAPRTQLFQLLCLRGEWTRALAQLSAAARLDPQTEEMARVYREVIRCEVLREAVFAGKRTPLFLGAPAPWMARLVDALQLDASGQPEAAAAARAAAFDEAPATSGDLDGTPFTWLADADSRLGPLQEAIVNGKYYWISLHQLREVEIEAPVDLRDVVWIPARLTFVNGGQQVAFLPSRYPLAPGAADSLMMARRTEWRPLGGDGFAGEGQRMMVTDAGDHPLLEIRHIRLHGEDGLDG